MVSKNRVLGECVLISQSCADPEGGGGAGGPDPPEKPQKI